MTNYLAAGFWLPAGLGPKSDKSACPALLARAGDCAQLVADATLARRELGWRPKHDRIEQIIRDAWNWEQRYPWWQ